MQGQRMYLGHRKFILPNKRKLMGPLLDPSTSEDQLKKVVSEAHKEMFGLPQFRTARAGRDVIGYPVPECMCRAKEAA